MLKSSIDAVMNPYRNALARAPKVARFQIMATLSLLWSMIFCASAGLFAWLPGYVVGHLVLLAIGIFGTRWIFNRAQRNQVLAATLRSRVRQ